MARHQQNVLWDVVDESFDEAEFLWRTWESSLDTHARNYRQVWFWTEDRLHGALDGVRLGGPRAAEELLLPALLRPHQSGSFMVAAHVLAADPRGWDAFVPHLMAANAQTTPLLARALQTQLPNAAVQARLATLGEPGVPWLVGMRTFAKQQSSQEHVAMLANSPHAEHRRLAMAAARLQPVSVARGWIERGLFDIDAQVCSAAVESGLVHGLRSAWARCLELGVAQSSAVSLFWMASLAGERERRLLLAALGQERTFNVALQAMGFLGTKEAAQACLQAMHSPPHARLAAEGFCAITGLELAAQNLALPEPAALNDPLSFELDDMNADLVPKLDDLLPLPDVEGVNRWWSNNEGRFDANERYIGGQALSSAALWQALATGPMRRRHVLAFELAVRTAGACDLQTRAFFQAQKRQLAQIQQHLVNDAAGFILHQPLRA
ncbi:MAG: TIGR02270 family protein [Deltaproteobacteria bacterium]|nr:TIGR02270 family protein [Deltaproteobacteria bacterium]